MPARKPQASDSANRVSGFESARKDTLAFMSGRSASPDQDFTFTCTVAFLRFASGEISSIISVVLHIRERHRS